MYYSISSITINSIITSYFGYDSRRGRLYAKPVDKCEPVRRLCSSYLNKYLFIKKNIYVRLKVIDNNLYIQKCKLWIKKKKKYISLQVFSQWLRTTVFGSSSEIFFITVTLYRLYIYNNKQWINLSSQYMYDRKLFLWMYSYENRS